MNWRLSAGVILLSLTASSHAFAQYRNTSFGFDASYLHLTRPSVVGEDGDFLPPNKRPIRIRNGVRIGGETSFKLDTDRWWFVGNVHLGVLQWGSGDATSKNGDQIFDAAASENMGTMMNVEAGVGIRFYIATNKIRPYMQAGTSYVHLFSVSEATGSECGDGHLCGSSDLLPHRNVGLFHFQPGIEVVIARDTALNFFVNGQYWLVFNAADNLGVSGGMGLNFFL